MTNPNKVEKTQGQLLIEACSKCKSSTQKEIDELKEDNELLDHNCEEAKKIMFELKKQLSKAKQTERERIIDLIRKNAWVGIGGVKCIEVGRIIPIIELKSQINGDKNVK